MKGFGSSRNLSRRQLLARAITSPAAAIWVLGLAPDSPMGG